MWQRVKGHCCGSRWRLLLCVRKPPSTPTYNGLHWQGLSIWFGRRRAIAASNSTLFWSTFLLHPLMLKPIKEYLTLKLNVAQFDLFHSLDIFLWLIIFWKFYSAITRLQIKFLKHFKTTSKPRLKFKWGQEKEGLPNLQLLDNKTLLRSLFVFNDSVITLQRTIPLSKFMMSMVTSVKAELWEQSYKSRLKDTCTLKKGPQRRDKKGVSK